MNVTLDKARANVGRLVVYRPYAGATIEEGVITSVSSEFFFVRYGADSGSKATRPEDLDWSDNALV
jgi:hypothetical protein